MYKVWVYLEYDHVSFEAARIAMVCVEGKYEYLTDYRQAAVNKLCDHIGCPKFKHSLIVHDWKVLEDRNLEIVY